MLDAIEPCSVAGVFSSFSSFQDKAQSVVADSEVVHRFTDAVLD